MSYHTYSVDGFGFSVDEISTNILRLRRLLKCAPEFSKEIDKYFKKCEITKPELDDYLEYDQNYSSGLAYILRGVIEEAESIELVIAEDFDGEWFVMLCPSYPWADISEKHKSLTAEKITEIFQKYIGILTDSPVGIEYQSVENGG